MPFPLIGPTQAQRIIGHGVLTLLYDAHRHLPVQREVVILVIELELCGY